uniref:Uncharacterized protein n=1 Tax=Arundo donax TaxID=35708 RepID=A0A0A9BH43_ARUDO
MSFTKVNYQVGNSLNIVNYPVSRARTN